MKTFFRKGFKTYYSETPTAMKCIKYLNKKYPFTMPKIDHIAYRNLNNVKKTENLLYSSNYKLMDQLELPTENQDFPRKAFWYKHQYFPRIFLSSISIEKLSPELIEKIKLPEKNINTYNELKELDQYLAWTYYWNEHINHIAIDLSNYGEYFSDIIEEMENDLDLNMNISENDGKYQISIDSQLLQCSTKSDIVDELPKSYIEFVYREILPESKIKIFPTSVDRKEGFDPISANTIFKSTKL